MKAENKKKTEGPSYTHGIAEAEKVNTPKVDLSVCAEK